MNKPEERFNNKLCRIWGKVCSSYVILTCGPNIHIYSLAKKGSDLELNICLIFVMICHCVPKRIQWGKALFHSHTLRQIWLSCTNKIYITRVCVYLTHDHYEGRKRSMFHSQTVWKVWSVLLTFPDLDHLLIYFLKPQFKIFRTLNDQLV